MTLPEIYQQLVEGIKATTWLEFVAVITGIASVWFSRKENILVYPVGMISTVIYIYISFKGRLIGEASVNLYYTVMSIYGWWLWTRKRPDGSGKIITKVTASDKKVWAEQLVFFGVFYIVLFFTLTYLKQAFFPGVIPWADAFASASAYTGMWLMAKKKLENWIWWIITDFVSVPLFFSKGYVFTSLQFLIFTILAIMGYITWKKKLHAANT